MSKDYEEPISEESSKTTRTVGNGAKHLQLSHDLVVVLCIREAVWLSGKGAGGPGLSPPSSYSLDLFSVFPSSTLRLRCVAN